jgi:hypothetical protein
MDTHQPLLSLIQGNRDEIEQELVRLILLHHPIPQEELQRLLSLLEPSNPQLKIVESSDTQMN